MTDFRRISVRVFGFVVDKSSQSELGEFGFKPMIFGKPCKVNQSRGRSQNLGCLSVGYPFIINPLEPLIRWWKQTKKKTGNFIRKSGIL